MACPAPLALVTVVQSPRRHPHELSHLMFRPPPHLRAPAPFHLRDQRRCAPALLLPLLAWICAALIVRYGYYGKCRLALGPNASLLMRTSSVFVERVQVQQGEERRILQVYGFSERPELSPETHNWTVPNHLFVDAYNREGVSMWLNKGSRIYMSWQCGGRSCEGALVVLIKGKEQSKELQRYHASSLVDHGREAEYTITEDDVYYLGVVNPTPRIMALTMEVNVTSTVYDASKAVHLDVWTVEVYFVARLFTYFVLIGIIVVIVAVILSRFGACDPEQTTQEQAAAESSETAPIVPRKDVTSIYGTNASDESRLADLCSSSSEDLYDGKICVICYDGRRDSYFIPCGHSATCLTCAQRIVQEENKICPICRRPIHKSKSCEFVNSQYFNARCICMLDHISAPHPNITRCAHFMS